MEKEKMTKLGVYYPAEDKIVIRKKRIKRYFKPCVSRALFIFRFHEWVHRIQWYFIRDAKKWNLSEKQREKQVWFLQKIVSSILLVTIREKVNG